VNSLIQITGSNLQYISYLGFPLKRRIKGSIPRILNLEKWVMIDLKTPEMYELEYLFECDARIVDEEVPWYYIGASSSLIRENKLIEFYVNPANRNGELRLLVNEEPLINLDLENITEVQLTNEKNTEGFKVHFDKENYVKSLIVQTKPFVKIEWGTSLELQS
jgi:hypothetical protein